MTYFTSKNERNDSAVGAKCEPQHEPFVINKKRGKIIANISRQSIVVNPRQSS